MNGEKTAYSTGIEPGDLLVGFREDGLGHLGLAAAHDTFKLAFGEDWHDATIEISGQHHKLGELSLRPPTVYAEVITDMNSGYQVINVPKVQVKDTVQITNGGILEQLGASLKKTGLGAEIVDPCEPPAIAVLAQALHPLNISDEEAYKIWCFGNGMIIVTPEADADVAVEIAAGYNIAAKIVGYVTERPGIRIRSRGLRNPGKMLSFEA